MIAIEAIGQVAVVSIIPVTVAWWLITLMASEMQVKDLKGHTPVVYLRISNREQAKGDSKKPKEKQQTFIEQLARVNNWLKDNGYPKAEEKFVFREVKTGGDKSMNARPILGEAISTAVRLKQSRKNKKVVLLVTEYHRFGRHHLYGPANAIPLYENDIPLVATDSGTIHGSPVRPTPRGNVWLGLDMTMGGMELDTTRGKEESGRRARTESGIYHSVGLALWPFADDDMFNWLRENHSDFKKANEGGIGKQAFKRRVESIGGKNGPKGAWATRAVPSMLEFREKLTEEEYDKWEAFRKRILDLEKAEGYDGARGVGPVSWLVKAIRYNFNGYLTKPWNTEQFPHPTEEEWDEVYSNPSKYLSAGDSKLYRTVVGKRKKS